MPPRKTVPTLRSLCLSYVSSNIDIWYKQTKNQCGDKVVPKDGTIACLPTSILDDIFTTAKISKRGQPQHLEVLIHKHSKKLDFSEAPYAIIQRGAQLICDICVNLQYLHLSGHAINENRLKRIASSIPNIISLQLESTQITDSVLAIIGNNCPKLRVLDISHSEVTNIGIKALCVQQCRSNGRKYGGRCRFIEKLYVNDTNVTDEGAITAISNLPLLTDLDYDNSLRVIETIYNQRRSADMRFKLKILNWHCPKTDKISNLTINAASVLCQNITQMSLNGVTKNDRWLQQLVHFSQLADLRIIGTVFEDVHNLCPFHECVEPLLKIIGHNLKSLVLDVLSGINLWVLGTYCTQLTNLVLNWNREFMPLEGNICSEIFSKLTVLRIECLMEDDISQDLLTNLLSNCQKLQSLLIVNCDSFTDEVLSKICEHNPLSELNNLGICECNHIGASSVLSIIKNCNSLRHLRYARCGQFLDADNKKIRDFVRSENLDLVVNLDLV